MVDENDVRMKTKIQRNSEVRSSVFIVISKLGLLGENNPNSNISYLVFKITNEI